MIEYNHLTDIDVERAEILSSANLLFYWTFEKPLNLSEFLKIEIQLEFGKYREPSTTHTSAKYILNTFL